jgi:single-stranded DNA-binding protein
LGLRLLTISGLSPPRVAVTGRLTYREWETKDGNKRSKHQAAGQVQFGSKPDKDGEARDE